MPRISLAPHASKMAVGSMRHLVSPLSILASLCIRSTLLWLKLFSIRSFVIYCFENVAIEGSYLTRHEESIDNYFNLCSFIIKSIVKIYKIATVASQKRKQQNRDWFFESLETQLKSDFYSHKIIQEALDPFVQKVLASEISPFSAARQLIALSKAAPNPRKP